MKIENLQKVNRLYAEFNTNKTRLKNFGNETIKLYGMELCYDNDEQTFFKDNELLEKVRWLIYSHIVKKIRKLKIS